MKKNILIILLLTQLSTYSQHFMGLTYEEIKLEYPTQVFEEDYYKGELRVSTTWENGVFVYLFNKLTKKNYFTMQIPLDIKWLNAQINYFNNNYVAISRTEWNSYHGDGSVMEITVNSIDGSNKIFYSFIDTHPGLQNRK